MIYIYYAFTFQRLKILFKIEVTYICLKEIKGKSFYTLLFPFKINRIIKLKKKITVKSGPVDRLFQYNKDFETFTKLQICTSITKVLH